ncbi:MAG: tripartite tricarboxylate transporter substrate binding protein [Betaproteobacteria bacterium]|nr:tripartite tricarboxylate transporter substrate binding protein [Betaproteobacteria bacterium]
MNRLFRIIVFSAACAAVPGLAAQGFPDRPVRFVVPFPPGGGTDAFARIVGGKLTEIWGQQVVIDNRGGAQGNIGTALGAKAPPDGYTITLAHQGALTINPHMYSRPGFDTLRDFAAVARGTAMAFVLVVHPSVAAKSMKDLAELARKNPGKLTFASTSAAPQLLGELFKLTTKTDMVHVPYKGAGPAVVDLLAGHVGIMFANPTSTVPHVKSGRLRALGVLGTRRTEALPDVPTAVESGFPEMSGILEWYGVVAPAATPRQTIAKLNAGVVRALNAPDVMKRLNDLGQTPAPSTVAEFSTQIRTEFERWGKVVKASGAKVD